MDGAAIIDEADHRFNGRSSSAWAKYADALRRILLAYFSSRTSRSKAFILSTISVGTPPRRPASISTFLTHSFSVCAAQPIFDKIDRIADQRLSY
ncbi:hypothetical protein FGD77_05975 [Roseovarius sp. M141]|nr:hypothetical protein [Roseovarius sp. M141]